MSGCLRASLVFENRASRAMNHNHANGGIGSNTNAGPSLKIENLDFTVNAHTSFLPGVAIQRRKISQRIPKELLKRMRKDLENEMSMSQARKNQSPVSGSGSDKGRSSDDKDSKKNEKKLKNENASGSTGISKPDPPSSSKNPDAKIDDRSNSNSKGHDHDLSSNGDIDISVKIHQDSNSNSNSPNSPETTTTERNGNGDQENDLGNYTIFVDQTFLPESPVNEYGITLRAMRCLEVSQKGYGSGDLPRISARVTCYSFQNLPRRHDADLSL